MKEVPLEWSHSYDSCRGVHKRYEKPDAYAFQMYNDNDLERFIQNHYPWFMDTYNSYQHNIQVSL
jgi:mannosyltransferase OCH1-like enzyme